MARPKKNAAKAASTKKTTAKKTGAKRGRKPGVKANAQPVTDSLKLLSSIGRATASIKRPPSNPDVPGEVITHLNTTLNDLKTILDAYAQHLRSLDRKRLNGVGIKKLGFIERAYELALENPEYLPHYLTIERFGTDIQYFLDFRSLTDTCSQVREKLWNITMLSSDFAYTDSLDYYSPVKEAARRRVDAAESIFAALSPFFKSHAKKPEEDGETAPTAKQELRNFKAMLRGKKDGIMVIENRKPKLTGGVHKVIDREYKDSTQFKGTVDGDIEE